MIGNKVICVDDEHHNEFAGLVFQNWVKKGEQYTIRNIFENNNIVPSVLLEEIHNTPVPIPVLGIIREPAFALWRFRKLELHEIEEEIEEPKEQTIEINLN